MLINIYLQPVDALLTEPKNEVKTIEKKGPIS